MKDRFFYPIAALIIGAMIYFALSLSVVSAPVDENIYELSGETLSQLFPSPGTTVQLANDPGGAVAYAVMGAHADRAGVEPSAGVFGTLGSVHEASFAGHPIRITIRARAGQFDPAGAMEAGYFTAGSGDSPWTSFTLTSDFSDHSFIFTPGEITQKGGTDFVGIWPDKSGKGGTIDVMSIRVEKIIEPVLRGVSRAE
ncbi:hypothetical protein [Fretibacter rubidus]|uniref:hypothetical protein n=1 Tax=Fretibacter rubidus TaxID=570162 RepID=UPI00352A1348